MIKNWIVDLRHMLLPNGTLGPLPPRALTLAQYWTEIVSQATNYDAPTTLRCRRRHGRRRCGELLTIFFDVDSEDVLWFCPHCRDQGRISGWQNSFWDHSDLPETGS